LRLEYGPCFNPLEKAMPQSPFHLAFPVDDLAKARAFYGELLGCAEGRSSPEWVDFDFYGHQIVAHLAPDEVGHRTTSAVDGDNVPVLPFRRGVVDGGVAETRSKADACRHQICYRTACALQRPGR